MKRLAAICLPALVFATVAMAQESSQPAPAAPATEPTPQPAPTGLSIEQAYQKEYAFLEAQRRDLESRIEQTRSRNAQAKAELQATVNRLQGAVVDMDAQADRLNEAVNASEELVLSNEENSEVLQATFQQAGATLEQYGNDTLKTEPFEALAESEKIQTVFTAGSDLLKQLSAIRTEQGVFYQPDGTEVSGTIYRVGNIAAYGQGGDVAGVLAPAGGGRMQIWPASIERADEVKAVMSGRGGEQVPVFLFESLDKQIEAPEQKTVMGKVNEGGTIGWIIVALGLLGLLMVVLRAIFLKRASTSTGQLGDKISALVRDGQTDEALALCRRKNSAPARVVAAAVRNLDRDRDHIEDIVSESILHESSHLNRFGAFILVIAAVAPLLGLLGTVTGMISTFDIIKEVGTGDPGQLAGGIAIALVTTQLGLIVAIPLLILGNLLTGWGEGIKDDMERMALKVINVTQDRRERLRAVA